MGKKKNADAASFWYSSVRWPLLSMVLLSTFALTALFYFAQGRESELYARYVETLSEYKFLDAHFMRSLERFHYNLEEDSAALEAELMQMREVAVSLASSMENFRADGDWMPEARRTEAFEREVLGKVSVAKRYLQERSFSIARVERFIEKASEGASEKDLLILRDIRESLRWGEIEISLSETLDSLGAQPLLDTLSQELQEQKKMWRRIDGSRAALWAEELGIDFKMRDREVQERRLFLSLVSYLLSLAMLLSLLVLFVQARR